MQLDRRRESALQELESKLQVRFENLALLDEALTHSSYANERRHRNHNERLEFLGDAVVGLVISHLLYSRYPSEREGVLARMKASLVSSATMAEIGRELGLGPLLRLGKGEERSGGRERESIIADAVEAVIGAVYLDQPWHVTHGLVCRLWESWLERFSTPHRTVDPKSALQEHLQALGGGTPEYRLTATSGPDHAKTFFTEVVYEGRVLATGSGPSKKEAEQEAARRALESL